MTGGTREDLELQETPRICPRHSRLTRRMDLWGRGLHAGLVGDANAEGAAREGRVASGGEEEEEAVERSYHDTVLSGKLRQAVRQATYR